MDAGRPRRKGVQEIDQEAAEHENKGLRDDLVEGVLQETPEPAPENPFELGHDEEGNKDRAEKNTDGGGDEAVGDHHDGHGLRGGEQEEDHGVENRAEKIGDAGGVHTRLEVVDVFDYRLQLGLIDLIG